MYRLILLFFFGSLLLIACVADRPITRHHYPSGTPLTHADKVPSYIKQFDEDFSEQLKRLKLPGAAVVIVQDSTILLMKGYGLRDRLTGDSIDVHSVFRIASLSKGFTGILAGRMVEEGCLEWSDKVVESVPEFSLQNRRQARRITVQHLLSHSSGLVRHAYTNLVESGLSIEQTIPFFSELPVLGREGKHFAYQNAAFSIIEEVIKDKTGQPFAEILEEEIFDPVGMTDASCSYEDIHTHDNVALPHWYSSRKKDYVSKKISKKYYNTISAGGVNASISDMAQWLNLTLGNRPDIISDRTLDHIFSPLVKSNSRRHNRWPGVKDYAYGLGWRVFNYKGHQLIYHGGYVNHYRSEIAIDRDENIAICVLFNAPTPYAAKVIPQFLEYHQMGRQVATVSQ